MAPPVAWQTHPPQRSPEVPVKGLRARPEGRPGHGRLGVAHTEMTGFTCRGAGAVAERDAVPAAATDQGLRESVWRAEPLSTRLAHG